MWMGGRVGRWTDRQTISSAPNEEERSSEPWEQHGGCAARPSRAVAVWEQGRMELRPARRAVKETQRLGAG